MNELFNQRWFAKKYQAINYTSRRKGILIHKIDDGLKLLKDGDTADVNLVLGEDLSDCFQINDNQDDKKEIVKKSITSFFTNYIYGKLINVVEDKIKDKSDKDKYKKFSKLINKSYRADRVPLGASEFENQILLIPIKK